MHSTLFVLGAENPSKIILFHPHFTIQAGCDVWDPHHVSRMQILGFRFVLLSDFMNLTPHLIFCDS